MMLCNQQGVSEFIDAYMQIKYIEGSHQPPQLVLQVALLPVPTFLPYALPKPSP
jgi:hypothetical protein